MPVEGFPDSSVGKESTCNTGDPGSIPESERSPGEGLGYPFPYSWALLVAQMVKNLPAMWETWVRSLDWEDPLEEDMQPTVVFLPGESPWTEEPGGLHSLWGHQESDMIEQLSTVHCSMSGSNCFFLTCIPVSQKAGKVVWYSHLF